MFNVSIGVIFTAIGGIVSFVNVHCFGVGTGVELLAVSTFRMSSSRLGAFFAAPCDLAFLRNRRLKIRHLTLLLGRSSRSFFAQIVFIGKMIQNEDWQSLSISKGNSKAYNAEKFAQEKKRVHFTDEFLTAEK